MRLLAYILLSYFGVEVMMSIYCTPIQSIHTQNNCILNKPSFPYK